MAQKWRYLYRDGGTSRHQATASIHLHHRLRGTGAMSVVRTELSHVCAALAGGTRVVYICGQVHTALIV